MTEIGQGQKAVWRGDPAAQDFAKGDLTTDQTWRDLDLSSIVPKGTRMVILGLTLKSGGAGNYIFFRRNGQSNIANNTGMRTQVANVDVNGPVPVFCDDNAIIEYLAENIVWTTINIVVTGYII